MGRQINSEPRELEGERYRPDYQEKMVMALYNFTVFEGLSDATLFIKDLDFTPPSALDELTTFHCKPLMVETPLDAGDGSLILVSEVKQALCWDGRDHQGEVVFTGLYTLTVTVTVEDQTETKVVHVLNR